jgi:tetratricopeptide (TPR) repeat protein
MNPKSPDEQLIRARELYYTDWDAAIRMYRELVVTLPIGHSWAAAHIDLAMYEYGTAQFESAVQLTQAVLDAGTEVETAGRAIAGILLCQTLEMLGRDIDEVALEHWVDDAVATNHPLSAASGTSILARGALDHHKHEQARVLMERAVELWNEAESMTGGPGILTKLALLDVEQGRKDDARRHLERALEWLKRFPEGGMSPRLLEKKILKQLDDLMS